MRQQVCKNKSWKKRVVAGGMAICMACTMPFSVQAENVTEEYNVQEDYSTESTAENVSDEKSEVKLPKQLIRKIVQHKNHQRKRCSYHFNWWQWRKQIPQRLI